MPGIEERQPIRMESGVAPEIPLELGEIDETGMNAWFKSQERSPDGFKNFIEELTAPDSSPETVNKWLWLLSNTREEPGLDMQRVIKTRIGHNPGLMELCGEEGSQVLTEHFNLTDVEQARQLFFPFGRDNKGKIYSHLLKFCQNNPRLVPLLISEFHRNFLPFSIEEVPFLASPSCDQVRTGDLAHWIDELEALPDHMELDLKLGIAHRCFVRARYHALAPVMEITARCYMRELSDEQAEKYCDSAIDALVAGEPYHCLFNQLPLFEQAQDHVVAKAMRELHRINEETDDKFFHLNERRRYILTYLIRCIRKEPAEIDHREKKCHILETDIFFPDNLPETAVAVEVVSSDGELGVFDINYGLLGSFSFFDMQEQGSGFRANFKPLSQMELFKDFNEADISPKLREEVKNIWRKRYPVGNKLLQAMPLREQAWFFHVMYNLGSSSVERLEELSLGSPLLLRCCLLAYAHSGFTEMNVEAALASSNHSQFARAWRAIVPQEQMAAIINPTAAGVVFDERTEIALVQLLGFNIYDRMPRYRTPDAVDTFVRMVDSAEQRAVALQAELAEKYPGFEVDRSVLVRSLVRREIEALGTYRDGRAQRDTYFISRQRDNFEFHSALAGIAELAKLPERDVIDLSHYLEQQHYLEELMSRNLELKPVVIESMILAGTLKPKPFLSWTVDRRISSGRSDKVSGDPSADTYEARLGAPVIPWLRRLKAARTTPGPLVIFEPGVGSGAFREAIKREFGDEVIIFGMADAVYYNPGADIRNLIDFNKLGVDLSETEQDQVGEILYKIIAIADGECHKERITYASDRLEVITRDPRAIVDLVVEQLPKLFVEIRAVPDTVCRIDASSGKPETIYPYHLVFADDQATKEGDVIVSEKVRQALKALQTQGRKALIPGDPLLRMPIRAEGVLIGDFDRLEKMADAQFDAVVDARALVYKRGDQWVNLMEKLARASNMGVWSDSVRDNEGYRYRLDEVRTLKQRLGQDYRIYIIPGPGFVREDFQEEKDVPLSIRIFPRSLSEELLIGDAKDAYEII